VRPYEYEEDFGKDLITHRNNSKGESLEDHPFFVYMRPTEFEPVDYGLEVIQPREITA
jgi:hypothetical protein